MLWESSTYVHTSLSLKPQTVACNQFPYLAAVLPHANDDVECAVNRAQLHCGSRTQRSGCLLGMPKLQPGARNLIGAPHFLPNAAVVQNARTPILGNVQILRQRPELLVLLAARARDDGKIFGRGGGASSEPGSSMWGHAATRTDMAHG